MRKKVIAILLSVSMLFGVVGCSSSKTEEKAATEQTEETTESVGEAILSTDAKETDEADADVSIETDPTSLEYALTANTDSILKVSDLLNCSDKVIYEYDGYTCTAYNEYIYNTRYANWEDAIAFIQLLNDNHVTPADEMNGSWKLPDSEEEFQAWAIVTDPDYSNEHGFSDPETRFGGVYTLWSSREYNYTRIPEAYVWQGDTAFWGHFYEISSYECLGFIPVWVSNYIQSDDSINSLPLNDNTAEGEDPGLIYDMNNGTSLKVSDLLASEDDVVTYEHNGQTCTAYNGFIKKTAYSTWYNAQEFVQFLNDNNVIPNAGGNGTWRLLDSSSEDESDVIAWASASGATGIDIRTIYPSERNTNDGYSYPFDDYDTKFDGIKKIWSSGNTDIGGYKYNWDCQYGSGMGINLSFSMENTGFLVIWESAD